MNHKQMRSEVYSFLDAVDKELERRLQLVARVEEKQYARSFRLALRLYSCFALQSHQVEVRTLERCLLRLSSKLHRKIGELARTETRRQIANIRSDVGQLVAAHNGSAESAFLQRWKRVLWWSVATSETCGRSLTAARQAYAKYVRRVPGSQISLEPQRAKMPDLPSGFSWPFLSTLDQIGRPKIVSAAKLYATTNRFRVAVFTCVVNGWDTLKDPDNPIENADYYAFTDRPQTNLKVWKQVPIHCWHANPVKIARFYKTHSKFFFPEYRFAIWADANIELSPRMPRVLERMQELELPIGAISHPLRQCVYEEARACARRNKDAQPVLSAQVDDYKKEGVPEHLGLFETGVMIFSHFDERAAACCDRWWQDIERYSHRDQVSFPVALSHTRCPVYEILEVGSTVRTGRGYELRPHEKMSAPVRHFADRWGVTSVSPVTTKCDAIVPIFNNPEMAIACIERLRKFPGIGELLLVDDFSQPENRRRIVEYARAQKLGLELNEKNLGYTKSVNKMFPRVQAPCVFIVNTDTLPEPTAMQRCVDVLFSRDRVGAVGPFSNAASFQSLPSLRDKNGRFSVNPELLDVPYESVEVLLEEFFGGQDYIFAPLLNGFFYCVKTKALRTVGGFDEENFEVFGEENDFVFRLQDAGYFTLISTKSYVPHQKGAGYASVNYDVRRAKRIAGQRLREKWGARVQASEAAMVDNVALKDLRAFLRMRLDGERTTSCELPQTAS